jgi:16S rRNA G966 N2-methylase RsmD
MYEWIHQLASGRVKIESGRKGMPTLNWIGKDKVLNHHLEVPFHVLERQYSFDEAGKHEEDNGSENMIIHGDNLLALKSLLPKYEGKIKCIYIDPPYNTGGATDIFTYNNSFNHSTWLTFMRNRLEAGKQLLKNDTHWKFFVDNIEILIEKYECVRIDTMGFPDNWKSLLSS